MKKILTFSVPLYTDCSVVVEKDSLPYMFNHLHKHQELQFTLILKGEGTLLLGNRVYPYAPNQVFFINSAVPHLFKSNKEYFAHPQAKAVKAIHIYFNYSRAIGSLNHLPEFDQLHAQFNRLGQGLRVRDEDQEFVANKVLAIQNAAPLNRFLHFISLLQYISEEASNYKLYTTDVLDVRLSDKEGEKMNKVFQYIMQHYHEDIPLTVIADIANLTPQAFCKYFKNKTRKTFCYFVNEIRINEAIKRMVKGEFRGIGEIALHSGFNSAVHFNRVFKRITGLQPRQYLKNLDAKQGKRNEEDTLSLLT